MAINIRLFKVLLILLYLIPFAGYSQVTITATATDAVCVGDGTISINVTNATGPIIYAVAKLPFDEATVIRSIDPLITHLARGDYYYGYYNGTTFVRATNPISVGGAYTTVSPTITYFAGFNYTYCGTDPDPLGTIRVGMAGVNPPYTISLFRTSDNSEVQKITTVATSSYDFKNVLPGTYRVELTDNCGVKTASINTVTLAANVKFTSDNITMSSGSLEIIYNTPGDVCSGIASASYRGGFAYTQSISPALFSAVTRDSFSYKLEIQNGADWDVYDNLTYTQVIGRFSLPTDRSKWGLVRLTASYCGVSKTVTTDYGASSLGKVEALKLSSFRIADDPANTNCGTTGKVSITAYGSGGCAPYTVQVTDTATNTTQSYTSIGTNTTVDFLVDIGQTYTFKLTDRSGAEAPDYRFLNVTSNPNKPLPAVTGPNNVFIDPVYFTATPPVDPKSLIRFYRRPSGANFGKSALAVYTPGLQGKVTVSLVSGPSPLTITSGTANSILGENLNQGNYKIRVQDSGCFDEVFDVVLDCYFSQIEITSISSTLSATACDRYVKKVGVRVSMVGTADSYSSTSDPFSNHSIYVRTVSGPVSGSGYVGDSSYFRSILREGTYEFVYFDQTYGTYEIGLTRKSNVSGFLTTGDLWEGTTTKTIEIKTNFPVFDLSQSGGIICSGNTTGDLYTKVNNVDATATYFLKKDTDTNFPATGQSDLVFRGLTAGNYVVRARTNCYDVEQPLILRVPSSLLIAGNSSYYCKGESLKLGLNPMGPITSIKWTLPDGSTLNTTELALDNLTTAQSGLYKVELNTLGGCYFTESVNITVNDPQTPTGASNQEFCTVNNATVANLSTTESNVIWYDAATAGNVISSTTALENNKIYYGSLKERNCESPTRLAVTVTLSDPKTPTGTSSQEFCKVDNKKVADLVTTESNVTWYDAATGGNVVPPTTILENNKIYYGSLKVGTCESPTRLAVTVTLSDPKTPTGTSIQEFCKVRNATVADLLTTESNVTWFDAGIGGNVISSTTALENNKVYYGSLKAGICESPTRLAVTVTLSDPKTPTTANTIQEFCKVNNSTVADLVTTESNVIWYDAATGGNVVAPTTILENNKIYYGSSKLDTCESPTRLAVTVTLSDPKTPTTNQTTQEFCKIDNKKVSDLATTESGVTWYDAATAGNVIASTAVLENNKIYYGSLKVGTCESPTRLAVTVTLSDPKTPTTNQTTQEFCKVDNKKVSDLATTESGVTWYDAATAGNIIASTAVLENNKIYYGSLKVGTCESPTRLAVTVTLSDPQTPTTNQTTQEFCKVDNKKVSDLVTTESGVTWYDAATTGNVVPSTTTLTNGTVYYGSLKAGTCESPTRLAVTVTLSDPKTPTTVNTTQEFCKVDNKKVSDLATTESGVTWYDAATAGNVVPSTTTLTNGTVYYGSLKVGTCESPTRLAVRVTLSDPKTPTTNQTTQEFCKVDNKKVSDLATTESGVTWYDAATAGNIVPSTTTLTNGTIYYGSLKVGTCESPTRLAVTVTLSDPQTPTTTNTTQEFCKVDNKKVSDLATTESGVTWYDAVTAGNVIASTTALENNKIYYGSLKVGTCESPTRLAVTVTLSDPQTPTTANTTQEFCKVDNKKVSDLATTESGVTWYDAATAGNVVPSTQALTDGTIYYGSLKVGTCESPTRLAVTVTLSDPQTPTTNQTTQEFCKVDNKKVSDLATTESGVTWYDAATAGNVVPSTQALTDGTIYYGSLKVGTCESPTRLAVTVTLSDPKTPTTNQTTQEFCKIDNKKVSDLATTESGVTWYDAATAGNIIASTAVLENNKIYYGSLKVGTCESPTRLAVTVTLSDPQTPTTNQTTQEFCKVDNKKVSDLATTESGVTWYDAATAGNVVPATTTLTNGTVYYGSLKVGTCESPTRLAVTVTLSDPKTPTTANTTQEFCKIDNKKISDLATTESGVTWYDAATAGNVVPSTTILTNGTVYYGSLKVGTCESPTRLAVTVTLSDPQTPTTANTTQEFCKVDNKKVSDLATTEPGVTWYDAATAGNVVPSTTTLTNGMVYYGSLKVGTCESPTRLAVTVTLSDPKTPTTNQTTQEFCKIDNKKVSDLATTESGVTWYDAATAGNVIASTAVLENNKVYYGSLKVGTCESPTRLAVTVTLSDPQTPTTNQTTQEFCKIDNKKVSDLATTESGVTWYDAATAGNIIASTTALENNKVYYGSLKVGTCESPTRLAVTVTLSDPQTPTTANTTQEFCRIDNKKVSDLATTESGVTWYDAATAGNIIASTTALENNKVYYGSLKVGTCESPTRLAVTVTLSDPKTPTTVNTTQEFCKIDNKKVADLATTESGVTWYDAATAGNVVPSTTTLTNGTVYYGSLKVGTCESPTRLAVTVTLSDPQTPTTANTTQEFCKIDNKKVADLATTESGVTWYDAATGGNAVASTTILENNKIYYGSLKVGTCESPTRLAVTVTLSDPQTPTTVNTTQELCKIDNKRVADLTTAESGVTWYDAATAGNVVPSTTTLTNGMVYYGSLKVGTCESPTRLAVTVTLSDPKTPTTANTTQEFCKVDNKKVSDLATTESGVTWYDAATAGNVVPSTTTLTNGTVYYGSLKVGTCESPTRLAVTVTLSDPKTPTTNQTTQEFCKIDNKKVSDLATTESGVTWYDAATAGNAVALTTILENNKIYYGSLKVGTCESPTRLAVTVTLSDPQTPTTNQTTQEFCKIDNKKVSDLATTESGVTWYDAVTAGNLIASTTVLENNKVYYGSLKVGTCESPTRLAVTVTLSDPQTPTTANTTQEFCKVDNKKVSDLATTESGVTWYDAATAGNVVPSTQALTDGTIYYGSLKVGTCESPTRLAVTVTLSDPQTPTTANTTQEFCKVDNKKVADLVTTESNVTWYDAATAGNVIASTTALENNKIYYGSLKVGTCESPTRLAVTVTLSDPQTPTTANATQEFCKIDNKRVADLATTESGVTWYDAATAGTAIASTAVLENNKIYYGSLKVGTCESPTRLAVTVTLSDPKTPTTANTTQEFCKVDNKKVSDLATTESGVTWYDAATAGNIVPATTTLTNGMVYYGSLKVGTCESPTRLAVTVTLSDPKTPTTANTTQEFCRIDNKKVSDLVTTESGVTWYDAPTAGNAIASTAVLENNKIYYGSLKAGTCESPTRLAVTVTLSDPKTPTTNQTTQEFCKVDNKKVVDLATTESGVTWYDAATAGNIIGSTAVLENNKIYYGSLKVGICESPTRLAVTVTLSDPQTPTTNQTTQEFCKIDNKKVSDLATTESGVTWYDAATAGNVVPSTTTLTNGTVYYGSLKVGTCESPTRLAVTVTLRDPQTPTTANTTQEFCKIDNKKVSDLATTESGVTWYDGATAGNVVPSTTTLTNGMVYYGSLKVGTCESPTRLAVTVTLSDPQTPTTANTTQEFCKVDNRKVADLATTESGVTWYDAATAGNIIASTAALENNKVYYGSLKVGTCESPTRLAVTVTLSDPQTPTTNQTTQEFCKVDNKKVSDLATTESGVTWYDAATAGNVIASTTALENNKVYYGSLKVGTCESPTRLAVTVTLSDPQTPTTANTTQEFCKVDNRKVADLATTESGVTWYDAATAGNVVPSTTTLTNGTVYYGSLKVGTCESPTRLAVTVTLSDPKTPTTANTTQEFCKIDNKKVADLATTESGVTWYDAATAGNVIGLTTVLEHNKIYYGSLKVGTCESPTRLAVTVTLSDPQTPTTNQTTQEFCKVDNRKVADLATTESGVTWYDAATAGNVVPSTQALTDGTIYYGSLKVGTCESPTRLAVTVTLSDPQTPTTANTTQEFCKVNNNKVSDLATTEPGVTWYDAATAGTVLASTTALENNKVYYGSLKVGTCESPTRLAVTVTLSDPQTPTTNQTTQEFCKVDNKKVSDLATTESGVTWYDAVTAGNVVPSTQALTDGTIYYGSLKVGTCESPTRLAVTVTLSDPQTPTTANTTQEFCKIDNKKVSDLATTESGVTWYDAATAGNVVPSMTTLTNGTVYYGSLKVGTCESPTRLAITVTLSDPQTPTTANTTQEFCKIDNKKVSDLATTESGVTWYDAATAGNVAPSTQALTDGTIYYGSLKVGTCESPTRLAVTVTLSDPQTPTTANTTQEFCKVDNKKVADLATTESGVTWYDAATAGNIIASTTVLENNKIYYGSLKVGTCESPTRLAVTVTLSDPQTPTTANTTQEFCKVDNKKVSDLATTERGVTWYDAVTAGNIIASTAVLENNKIYYGSLKVGTCESPTRLAVTVTLSDPQTPTTANTTQEFCKIDNKKVSDLATTESGVTWYDAATAGTVLASTTALENNKIYYGSLKVGTCESPTRLAVTVTLSDPKTPTTNQTTQEFCKIDNKKVSDLATTESGVTWYDAATAGNVIGLTTVLEHNKIYYGSLKVGTCESPTRLAVTVTLSDPQTPTAANTTQEFCKIDNKRVGDLTTTESGVTWYDAATAGNAIASTAVLENNKIYYGSLKVGNCESPTRLAVTVTLSDPKTPTTANTIQEFCKTDNKRVSDLVTTESNVTWYDAATGGNKVDPSTLLEHNKDYYGSLKEGACESPIRLEVKVIVKSCIPAPAPNWNGNGCAFDETTYKVLSGMSNYNWFVSKEGTIVAGGQLTDDYITVLWNSVGKAIVKVDYIDVSKFDPLVSVDFPVTINSCSDIGLKKVVDNANPFIGKEVVFTITAENFGTNQAKDITISEALPSGYVYVASEASAGKYNPTSGIWTIPVLQSKEIQTLKVTAKVKEKGDYLNIVYLTDSNPVDNNETNNRAEASIKVKDVIVYNSVSPNGDDLNDYLRIDGLDQYPNNSVEIFNTGGVQIFKTSNYGSNGNVFRGISEGRVTIDKQRGVPTGTYFYILRYEADGVMNEKTGYLYVKN